MASILAGITILFAAAWCAAGLLHRASAASRHAVWTCAFAAVLLLAPLRWGLPHHAITPAPSAVVATTVRATVQTTATPSFDPTNAILILWAAGTLIMTLRLLRNAFRLGSIVRSAQGERPILVSPDIRGPVVTGVLRPLILLPDSSVDWTRARRRAVLAHEAAHIRRHDPAILLAAHITTALYWFHPLCWLAAARLRAESERACDDAALGLGLTPSDYAGHLLDLARKFPTQLAIPMATTSHLESRVKSILDPATNRSFPTRAVWFAAAAFTVAALAPLTTLTLRAQQAAAGTAGITGTVSDPTGAVVPGAYVTATNSDVSYEISTVSGPTGVYSFANLPGGHYTIEASVPGFARFHVTNMVLVNGANMRIDAHLSVGKITMTTVTTAQGQAKPQAVVAPASATAQPVRIGGMVEAAKVIRMPRAVYPADLQAQGVEGTVVFQAMISKEGVPHSITLQNAGVNQEFVSAAMAAFTQWRFKPTLLNGEPVEVVATAQLDFKLK